ncbi:hypothetical protein Tco_0182694, partial [Tanacetum coccineum]
MEEVAGRGGRRKKVASRGGRRKKVAGRGGRRKKVTGKGGCHEEDVSGRWSPIYLEVEVAGGKKVEEEPPEKVCWEDESPVETDGWWGSQLTSIFPPTLIPIFLLLLLIFLLKLLRLIGVDVPVY